jgi:DnaJ-class molecular chaperone
MPAMTYQELQQALKMFDLGEQATLREIKTRHRELAKRYHPDAGNRSDGEAIRQLNEAYRLLLEYTHQYRFGFDEDTFYEQCPEERIRRQFEEDPVWGGHS